MNGGLIEYSFYKENKIIIYVASTGYRYECENCSCYGNVNKYIETCDKYNSK